MSENRAPPAAGQQQQHSSSTTPTNTGSLGASQTNNGSSVPMTQLPGNPSFRSGQAELARHATLEKCAVMLPALDERGDSSHADLTEQSPRARQDGLPTRDIAMPRQLPPRDFPPDSLGINTQQGLPDTDYTESYASQQRVNHSTYAQYMKPKFARAPIKEAGRVAYLGESSNLSLLVQDRHGTTDVVH
ncbi:hypothetical protein KC355_g13389, partial [Hortaea werneckii]